MTSGGRRLAWSIAAAAGLGLAPAIPARSTVATVAATPPRNVIRVQRASAVAERFVAAPGETLEILFADGTSVTLGPQSAIVVDRFQWDAAAGTGAFGLTIAAGQVRVIGGGVSRVAPIAIATPGATLALTNGAAFVSVGPLGTRAALLIAGTLRVTIGARSRTIARAGFEVTVAQRGPTAPRRQRAAQAYADAVAINPGLAAGGPATVVNDPASPRKGTRAADRTAGADGGDVTATTSTLAPGSLDRGAGGQPSLSLPTTGTIASNGNVVGSPGPPPPTGPTFDSTPVGQGGSVRLALGLPSTGSIAASGNGNTGDTKPDVLLAQNYAIGDPRSPARARANGRFASRVVPAGAGTFAAAGQFVTRTSTATMPLSSYGFSSGISLDNATLTYADRTGRTMPFNRDFLRSLFFIGSSGTFPVGNNDFMNAGIVLPASVFGAADAVKATAHLVDPVPVNRTGLQFSDADFQSYIRARGAVSDADYPNLLRDYLSTTPIAAAPVPFGTVPKVDLTVRTIQAGFPATIPNPIADATGNESGRAYGATRADDNFLYIELTDNLGASPIAGQKVVFAAGDVSRTTIVDGKPVVSRTERASIDTFALVAGLAGTPDPALGDAASGRFRAFLPEASVQASNAGRLAGTPLYVANPGTAAPAAGAPDLRIDAIGARAFQADLALSADGRASTISATIGRVDYAQSLVNPAGDGGGPALPVRTDVTLAGRTVGSSREGAAAPTLFTSPVVATAVGGGRAWTVAGAAAKTTRPGYAGYLVLENMTDPVAVGGAIAVNGRAETLGVASATAPATTADAYGYVRVLAGDTSIADIDTIGAGLSAHADGYVAGVQERADAGGRTATPYVGRIGMDFDAVRNEMAATVTYADGTQRVVLGGIGAAAAAGAAMPDSAYVTNGVYGAVAASNRAALVSGEAVKAGLGDAKIATYQYVRWGFFFGDMAGGTAGGDGVHTALSTWVAGQRFDPSSCATSNCGLQGTARYAGHAIGNVVQGDGSIYTAVGSFDQSWDLTARTGTMNLAFDKATYATGLTASARTLDYAGTSTPDADGRAARITGELVAVPAGGGQPRGTIGQFEIRGPGTSYQANGTFAGDVRP